MLQATERNKKTFTRGNTRLLFICERTDVSECPKLERLTDEAAESCARFCENRLLAECADGGFYVYKLRLQAHREGKLTLLTAVASFSDRGARKTLRRCVHTFKIRHADTN